MVESGESRGVLHKLSIEKKLPLIMGSLLLLVILALSGAAYVEMRSTAMRGAAERLSSVTVQFRELFQQSTGQLRVRTAAWAAKPVLAEYARGGRTANPRARERALDALRYTGPQAEQVIAAELRDSTGAVLLSTVADSYGVSAIATNDVLPSNEPGDSAGVGRFRMLRDTMVYPVAVRIAGTNAYVVHWRRLSGTRRAREQMTRLIGSDATMFFGNADGTQWTDLEGPVSGPPIDPENPPPIGSYRRGADNERHLASAMRIPGTPWLLAVDFPYANILAPAQRFLWRIAAIALVALILALVATRLMSRRLTEPLAQVTDAAVAMANGDYSRTVRVDREDELGKLGKAFSTMATEVQLAREGLERKVAERTRELNDAMTQLHDTQESLVRRERLAMLGQLSSGVGHELRNPLGVMTNAVYFLKAVLPDAQPKVKEYLEIISQQVTLSEKIVGDLLDFARSKPPQRKPTPVAEATEAQLARLGKRDGVRIETFVSPDLPPALVDPIQFGQIVFNLLTNAVQALDGNGKVTVRAGATRDGGLTLQVADTGPGVAQENLEKIFEPLFTTKARGIGLGLAVSRTLARANSGDLTVHSTPGQGATFTLTLDAVDAVRAPLDASSVERTASSVGRTA